MRLIAFLFAAATFIIIVYNMNRSYPTVSVWDCEKWFITDQNATCYRPGCYKLRDTAPDFDIPDYYAKLQRIERVRPFACMNQWRIGSLLGATIDPEKMITFVEAMNDKSNPGDDHLVFDFRN